MCKFSRVVHNVYTNYTHGYTQNVRWVYTLPSHAQHNGYTQHTTMSIPIVVCCVHILPMSIHSETTTVVICVYPARPMCIHTVHTRRRWVYTLPSHTQHNGYTHCGVLCTQTADEYTQPSTGIPAKSLPMSIRSASRRRDARPQPYRHQGAPPPSTHLASADTQRTS